MSKKYEDKIILAFFYLKLYINLRLKFPCLCASLQLELTGTGTGPRQQQEGNLGLSVGSAGGGAALADIGITGPRLSPAATSITSRSSNRQRSWQKYDFGENSPLFGELSSPWNIGQA